ncbi:hypothetical protein B4135_3430 [Caldibacillus debilis]|uniref:Uncharacterized protein n=1 Tax=Caldibacillus debilis TaxID=301148 RepID=A0A150LF27_9BACI|nr:hypothetical protein B4135_3430 [Caldibacillus debilis]
MADRIHPERSGGFARAENKPRRFWIGNAACGGEPVSQVNGTPVFFCRPKRRIILWADFKWGTGGAASRGPVHARSGSVQDGEKMKIGLPQFRVRSGINAARTAGKPRSALLGRSLSASRHRDGAPFILSPFSSSGAQAEAGRPRDRRIPLRVLPAACRGPARGRRDFRGERERNRDGQKASAGDGGPFCQTFGFRKGLGRPGRPVGNLPRLDRIRLQSVRRPGRSAGNLPPAMAPKNRGTTSAVFTGWEGPE